VVRVSLGEAAAGSLHAPRPGFLFSGVACTAGGLALVDGVFSSALVMAGARMKNNNDYVFH